MELCAFGYWSVEASGDKNSKVDLRSEALASGFGEREWYLKLSTIERYSRAFV